MSKLKKKITSAQMKFFFWDKNWTISLFFFMFLSLLAYFILMDSIIIIIIFKLLNLELMQDWGSFMCAWQERHFIMLIVCISYSHEIKGASFN